MLLVEDNATNRKIQSLMLTSIGVDFDVVENGQEAVDLITNGSSIIEMILMDAQMPVMDGFRATQAIREWEGADSDRSHIPIIALTANAMEGDRERCIEAGMDDYVRKPVDKKTLSKVLSKWRNRAAAIEPVAGSAI